MVLEPNLVYEGDSIKFDIERACRDPWGHPEAPLAPDPKKSEKDHFLGRPF